MIIVLRVLTTPKIKKINKSLCRYRLESQEWGLIFYPLFIHDLGEHRQSFFRGHNVAVIQGIQPRITATPSYKLRYGVNVDAVLKVKDGD